MYIKDKPQEVLSIKGKWDKAIGACTVHWFTIKSEIITSLQLIFKNHIITIQTIKLLYY